jgi:hypothetical protein
MIPTTTFGREVVDNEPDGSFCKYRPDKPKFTEHRYRIGGILDTNQTISRGATALLCSPHDGSSEWPRRHDAKDTGFGRR